MGLLSASETPEGAKIGIVKSLSMMANITVQNSTQHDVIKSVLKTNKNIKHPYDINPLTMNQWVKIFINGDWYGVCKMSDSLEIYDTLKKRRRENIIDKMTSILFDFTNKEIRIYYDGGRLIRPLLIVGKNKVNITAEVIGDINTEYNLNDKTKSWKKIISKHPNLVEYEDIESLNFAMVAENEDKLNESITAADRKIEYSETTKINRYGDYRFVNYTHCDFPYWVMMGTVVANIPFSNHTYGNRNILHFAQAKQSIGIYMSSYKDRMDISQILYHPQLPLVNTKAMKYNHCLDLPYGENAIVAIASYTGLLGLPKL
jgi:DNA-directed RNA polymerase II subunit RPB2